MPYLIKSRIKQQIDIFRKSFLQSQGLAFDNFFQPTALPGLSRTPPHKRSSVFPPLVTLKAFIFQVLSDDGSCKQAVASVLVDRIVDGQSANTINTGPYCKARQRLPLKQLTEAATTAGMRLHQQTPDVWRFKGYNVVHHGWGNYADA